MWGGGGGAPRLCPRQFLFWRDKASCPRYLSIGVLHTQNFLIYITGLCIQTKLSHLRTSWEVMQEKNSAPKSFATHLHVLSRLTLVAINGELARRLLSWQYSLAIRLPSLSEHMYVHVKVFECLWIPAAWNQRIYGIITPVSPFSSHWLPVFYYDTTHSSQANPWTFVKLPNTCKIWSFKCWYWF